MRFVIPEPELTLYEDGFENPDHPDPYGRKKTGEQLSELVEKIDDPLVIALDGEWGCGKSYFLKRWVGAHKKENDGGAETVYFDAFAYDFLDDPLIALTGEIAKRFEGQDNYRSRMRTVKAIAAKLWRPAVRIGLAAGTAGASAALGVVVDAALKAGSEELQNASELFWRKEDGKRAAMGEFRNALIALTKPDDNGDAAQKLVIVVDELDRCRPDYALSLLEIIKHFFAIPHVHFVLGVNLEELQNSVKARYGEQVNAAMYLQKFISLTMRLPVKSYEQMYLGQYFLDAVRLMKVPNDVVKSAKGYVDRVAIRKALSFRSVQKLLTRLRTH